MACGAPEVGSPILMKAQSPCSEPPIPIQPKPAVRHFGSNGTTAIFSRFLEEV